MLESRATTTCSYNCIYIYIYIYISFPTTHQGSTPNPGRKCSSTFLYPSFPSAGASRWHCNHGTPRRTGPSRNACAAIDLESSITAIYQIGKHSFPAAHKVRVLERPFTEADTPFGHGAGFPRLGCPEMPGGLSGTSWLTTAFEDGQSHQVHLQHCSAETLPSSALRWNGKYRY